MARLVLGAVLAVFMLFLGGSMHGARAEVEQQSIVVHLGDLDMTNMKGGRRALLRISRAASEVCGGRPYGPLLMEHRQWRTCMVAATADAVRRLDRPMMYAVYEERFGTMPESALIRTAARS